MLKKIYFILFMLLMSMVANARFVDMETHLIIRQTYDNITFQHPFEINRIRPTILLKNDGLDGEFSFDISPDGVTPFTIKESTFKWDYDPFWLTISGGYFKKELWYPNQSNRFNIPTPYRGEAESVLEDYGITGRGAGISLRFRTPDKKYTFYTQLFESNLPNRKSIVLASNVAPLDFVQLRFNASYIPGVHFKISTSVDTCDFVALEAGGKIGYDFFNIDFSAIHTDDASKNIDQTFDAKFVTVTGGIPKLKSSVQYEILRETKAIEWRSRKMKKEYYAWDISYYPVEAVRLQLCYRLTLDYDATLGAERENDELILQAQFKF